MAPASRRSISAGSSIRSSRRRPPAKARALDVSTLDLRLPDMAGKAMGQRLRPEHPQLAAKVVFMTGDPVTAETQTFLQSTGRPILAKPLTIERVRTLLDELLADRPTES